MDERCVDSILPELFSPSSPQLQERSSVGILPKHALAALKAKDSKDSRSFYYLKGTNT